MDRIGTLHDIISDLPEGFKPLSPIPDLADEGTESQSSPSLQSDVDKPFVSDQIPSKRKHTVYENDFVEMVVGKTEPTEHSPPKSVRETVPEDSLVTDFHGAFDIPNESNINTQTFSPDILSTNVNQLTSIPTLVTSPQQAVYTTCPSVSNEAEDIVRKLCRNGKVMEFQEGEDFIKVIVYEDSDEDSEKENNPTARYRNDQRCTKTAAQSSCRSISQQGFQPQAQSTPAMIDQKVNDTPHPRNGYMFYNSDGTPTSTTCVASRSKQTANPCAQMNYGLGKTPTSVPLNSSGEENTSPTDQIHAPSSQQIQNRVRSLISFPQYQQVDENGKIREQHNQKERRRRARIKEACNLLRQLVPGMSDKTDKATVFEFAARYVHFLKSHTGAQFDKDFLMKYSPY